LVAVTKSGKVFALDSSNGHTIWSRNLGITDYTGAELHVEDMWTVREFGDSVNPTLAILATRTRDGVSGLVTRPINSIY
jgi:outer membrane protein assembly factor BamB